MKNKNVFLELAMITRSKLLDFGLKETSLSGFDTHVKFLNKYLIDRKIEFNLENGNNWHNDYKNGRSQYSIRSARRTVLLLWDCQCGNLTEYKVYKKNKTQIPNSADYVDLLNRYLNFIEKEGHSNSTLKNLLKRARYFLLYLERSSISAIADLTHSDIAEYFASNHFSGRTPLGIRTESSAVRTFLKFLSDEQISDCQSLCFAVPRNYVKQEKIITVISDQAEELLLSDYPNLPTNKRTKAMCLLALRLGLRTKDILDLKFENVNWENSLLELKLSKNGKHVKRIIDNETKNSLIDYILTERREVETPYIFTTAQGPKKRFLTNSLSTSEFRIFGLDIAKHIPNQGLHILRRTFATKLLNNGAPLSVISAALGHVEKSQVDHYLSVDEKKMRSCALSLASIEFGRSEF